MDINQSSLSQSNLTKPGIARSVSENKAIAEAGKAKDVQSTAAVNIKNQPELGDGQIVKGQLLDHRYNEVRIQLEPGKQIISARLSGDVPLAIGQQAQFVVSEGSSDRLVLRYLPESISASDATIQKALSASGLPMTDRNKAIVEELLNHTMPVDKQTLQTLIRLSNTNREASPLTLVLMFKNNLPMTSSNIRQFEAYQSGTNQLIEDIQDITKSLTQMLHSELEPSGEAMNQNITFQQALKVNQQLLDILFPSEPAFPVARTPINQIFQPESLQLLTDTLIQESASHLFSGNSDNTGISPILLTQLKEGTLPLEETMKLATRLYSETSSMSLADSGVLSSGVLLPDTPVPDIVRTMAEQYTTASDPSASVSTFLSPQEQSAFAELLRKDASLTYLADQFAAGSVSAKEVLTELQSKLQTMTDTNAVNLLSSPVYQSLMERAFHDKWTITPEKLAKKSNVKELYDHLMQDMDKLTKLSKLSSDESRFGEPMKNIRENLHFMKDLNEMFTYLQLPVQLQHQDVHSELYVYTKKKALQNKENLSVLLHLDMTNLGSMNIHIQMDHNIVRAKFYLENAEARELIAEHLPFLTDALTKKGYHLQSEVSSSYKKPDFSKDFIEDTMSEGDVKRYTFDIRT